MSLILDLYLINGKLCLFSPAVTSSGNATKQTLQNHTIAGNFFVALLDFKHLCLEIEFKEKYNAPCLFAK